MVRSAEGSGGEYMCQMTGRWLAADESRDGGPNCTGPATVEPTVDKDT